MAATWIDVPWFQRVVMFFHVIQDGFDRCLEVSIIVLEIGYKFWWDGFFQVK